MKAALPLSIIVLVSAPAGVISAPPGGGCAPGLVENINNVTALIDQNATDYWAHRANYVDLIYGPSSRVVPNAMQVAEQEKSQADSIKQGMPARVNSLKGLLRAAQAQGCLTPQLASVEPSITHGKRVNFDQIPTPEAGEENLTGPGPPAMPLR